MAYKIAQEGEYSGLPITCSIPRGNHTSLDSTKTIDSKRQHLVYP